MTTNTFVISAILVLVASVAASAQPANDDFDSAKLITSLPFEDTADTSQATRASDDPDEWQSEATVWYSFKAVNDTYVQANTCGADYETTLSVWVGDRGALQLVASGEDYLDTFDTGSYLMSRRVQFGVSSGITYYLMVGAACCGAGGGYLHLAAETYVPAANDDIDSATVVSALPFEDAIETYGATKAADDPDVFDTNPSRATVWYSFTPLEDTYVQANTFGSDFDTTLSVWGDSSLVVSNNDAGGGAESMVHFAASKGTTYYLMAGSFPGVGCDPPGGHLKFSMDTYAGLSFEASFEIDPVGYFDPKSRTVKITGKAFTSRPAEFSIEGTVQQKPGKLPGAIGYFSVSSYCQGEGSWAGFAFGSNRFFTGGKADVTAHVHCYDSEWDRWLEVEVSRTVGIRGPGGSK